MWVTKTFGVDDTNPVEKFLKIGKDSTKFYFRGSVKLFSDYFSEYSTCNGKRDEYRWSPRFYSKSEDKILEK